MDMKKLIQKMTDLEAGKQMLNESVVDECGGSMPMAPQQQGNPVTVSVNFNASGAENVMELLNLLKNSGLQAADGPSMPSQGMRMDMENFRNIVDAGDDENEIDVKFDMDDEKGIKGMSKAESAKWGNNPNEIYADHQTMTKDLSGGLNRQKKMYKPAAKGDNPIAVKQEGVDKDYLKSRLLQALEEKKSSKKPDADGDGVPDWADKKPGKDDHADKKKVGEARKTIYHSWEEVPTPLPNKKAYAVDKASEKKKPVSVKKAPWDKKEKGETNEASTGDYSAKKARAGKDIGKPGKQFSKIAAGAAKRYGSEEKGKKVAGAVLAKLRKK